MHNRWSTEPLLLGFMIGSVFGAFNLAMTWRDPLGDDSPAALLRFYGPMFLALIAIATREAQRTGRVRSGVSGGVTAALATFCVFVVLNFVRVNVFLEQLTGRDDWQNLMTRFRVSGFASLRVFVNVDYLRGTPFVIAFAMAVGAAIGVLGGAAGRLMHRKGAMAA
jgi:hypothetical protein